MRHSLPLQWLLLVGLHQDEIQALPWRISHASSNLCRKGLLTFLELDTSIELRQKRLTRLLYTWKVRWADNENGTYISLPTNCNQSKRPHTQSRAWSFSLSEPVCQRILHESESYHVSVVLHGGSAMKEDFITMTERTMWSSQRCERLFADSCIWTENKSESYIELEKFWAASVAPWNTFNFYWLRGPPAIVKNDRVQDHWWSLMNTFHRVCFCLATFTAFRLP